MPVEVASGAVGVLGGAGVGVSGEDRRVAQRDAGIKGIGDRGMPKRVGADVPGDARGLGDPGDHAVDVAPIDGMAGDWSQDQRAAGALATAGLQDTEHGDSQRHRGGLVALADEVQHPIAAKGCRRSPRSSLRRLRKCAGR